MILKVILALLLLGGLLFAGWGVYRRLPNDGRADAKAAANRSGPTMELTILLSRDLATSDRSALIELYPVDLAALQRQFEAIPRAGKQFDEFLANRLKDVAPVRASTDSQGRAVANVSEGNWWLHAQTSLASGEDFEWRLPLNLSAAKNTVELSRENAYERTKKF